MNRILLSLFCALTMIVACTKDDPSQSVGGTSSKDNSPYFFVKYHGDYWHTTNFNATVKMKIKNAAGEYETYDIGSRDIIIGPVSVGFIAEMIIDAPSDGGIDGYLSIARNSDFIFIPYGEFANSKKQERITYTITDLTGK